MGTIFEGDHVALQRNEASGNYSEKCRMSANDRLGFMQGRLSPLIDGRIQVFPWSCWQEEFMIAERHGFRLMEWTLDQHRLYENPLLTLADQARLVMRLSGASRMRRDRTGV